MKSRELVYLVNAGNDPSMSPIVNDYSFPALGVLSLGTWLEKRVPDLEIICRDGGAWSQERILAEIQQVKPMLVGVSTLCTSYRNSLEIADVAHQCSSKVVFGNDQASQNSRAILECRKNVDYVIGAEYGELDLELLVRALRGEKIALGDIPSLTYRQGKEVKGFSFARDEHLLSIMSPRSGYSRLFTELKLPLRRKGALDIFPIVNRNLYPQDHWDSYLANYSKKFAKFHTNPLTGVTVMNRARGCSRQGNDTCKHCDMLLDISMSTPALFWEEVRAAHAQVNATSFYEACDSFSSFPTLIQDLVRSKPSNLGFAPDFFVYCQARDLANHPERVDLLKDLGVFRVNIGLESMHDLTLKHMKGSEDSVEKNYRALELVRTAGIKVYASFVFGSEAENDVTLSHTVREACTLIREGYLCEAEAQPVLPLFGNYQGRILQKYGLMCPDSKNPDWPLDTDTLSKTYIGRFSGVSYAACVEATNEIRECARQYQIHYGSGACQKKNYV